MKRESADLEDGAEMKKNEDGSAMVIALLIMILLMGFAALAISRTTNETIASANDAAESKTFDAAHASLEVMTRNFNKIFETKLNPDSSDLTRIQGQLPPGFTDFTIVQNLAQTQATRSVVMTGEMFQGLNAMRDEWTLDALATSNVGGTQVALRRKFFNNRIPIFQFGIFYDDDLEFHPGPRFDFGGRVHSNGNLFMQAQTGLYFSSKVTTKENVFTNVSKSGRPWTDWNDNVFIKNASGTYVKLANNMGSVLTSPANGSPITTNPLPTAYRNANWTSDQGLFQGNLLSNQKPLELPLKLNSNISGTNLDYVELVKRGKAVGDLWNDGTGVVPVTTTSQDDGITAGERYFNKTGINVTLADSKARLPGCATSTGAAVTTPCGVRLDGDAGGQGTYTAGARGYQPRAMNGTPAYQATRVNGERLYVPGREVWIRITTKVFNPSTQTYDSQDITEDILSLGLTEPAPNLGNTTFQIVDPINYVTNGIDSRSIVKLQRFMIGGASIPTSGATSPNGYIMTNTSWAGGPYNYVHVADVPSGTGCAPGGGTPTYRNAGDFPNGYTEDSREHWRAATIGTTAQVECVVPFPIEMFDTREGLFNDTSSVFDPLAAGNYGTNRVPYAGVMSMVDIDVYNLKRFLDGNFDSSMPAGTPFANAAGRALRGSDIPNSNGWVFYVSDRRGDYDFDGDYDMEDIYGNNDGVLQPGEDVNKNGSLNVDFLSEAVRYNGSNSDKPTADIAAVFDHAYYRRGVRVINARVLPGNYDSATPANSKGFTLASENGVYVWGDFNATGIASVGSPTPASDYLPQNTSSHVSASIAADSVTILSNSWRDGRSFAYPFTLGSRRASETTLRFAMLTGDSMTTLNGSPNQGGGDPRMNGGVHNFKRFLEDWGSTRLNYAGSLINLFNSRNNNGAYKCCNNVYSPPNRNWVFDTTFLDINRLPPGTPFFQAIQVTGFQRVN